jgi:nitrate reductase gamma subunit
MKILVPFIVVIILIGIVFIGVEYINLQFLFGVIIPYIAILIFIVGVSFRIIKWACSPVPFRIPTTCGQQKSLSWIKRCGLENPANTCEVIGRMLLEILLFRSLFRNTKSELREGTRLVHDENKWLWLVGLAFHWSFFIVVIRHIRLFIEPVPECLKLISTIDGFLQIGSPVIYISGIVLLIAVTLLLLRRILFTQIRYISLPADYFPLFLIIGIAGSGIIMRYITKVDVVSLKEFIVGMFSFTPGMPPDAGVIFYIHIFLVSVLLIYFPFSKLIHMGGIFLSPTRNMANNSRMKRHVNPWNYDVKVHTYEEYEEEFRDKMKQVGIPVEKE